MEYLFCQHSHIVMGTIEAMGREPSAGRHANHTSNPFYEAPLMSIRVDRADEAREIISGEVKPLGKASSS